MRRLKILGLAIMAVFALAAVAVATASAAPLPTFLWNGKVPTAAEPVTFVNGSGKATLQKSPNGLSVVCTKSKSKGEFTSASLGSFDILFEGCEGLGFGCTGLEDTAGSKSILSKGTFHLVFDTLSPTLGVGVAFLTKPVHFECSFISVVVEGCALGLIKPINKLLSPKEKYELLITQKEGFNTETKYLNDNGELVTCILLSKEGTGEFKQSGEGAENAVIEGAKVGTKEVSTEIMG